MRLHEPQAHDGQVRGREGERGRQRVDGRHQVDLRAMDDDSREHQGRRDDAEHDDRDVRRLELRVELREALGQQVDAGE